MTLLEAAVAWPHPPEQKVKGLNVMQILAAQRRSQNHHPAEQAQATHIVSSFLKATLPQSFTGQLG